MDELDPLQNIQDMNYQEIIEESEVVKKHALIKCVIVTLIALVSLIGNGIIIRTLIVYKDMRIPIYIVIGGMATADFVRVILEIPEQIILWTDNGRVISEAWCKTVTFLATSCVYLAAYHLVVLVALRGILLTDRANTYSSSLHALITSVILWIIALLANIPLVKMAVKTDIAEICVTLQENPERFLMLTLSFSYILPLALIIIVYIATVFLSRRYFEDSYLLREKRLSRMVTVLVLVFAICRLPYEILEIMVFYEANPVKFSDVLDGEDSLSKLIIWYEVRDYLKCLALLPLALRPVIYAKYSGDWSESFDEIINCTVCRTRGDRHGGEISMTAPLTGSDESRIPTTEESIIGI